MNLQTFGVRPLFMVCVGLMSLSAWAVEDNAALIKQGEYVARAADCGACHRTVEKDGPKLAGGYAIESPMGKIIASNITPSKTHGIGNDRQLCHTPDPGRLLGKFTQCDQGKIWGCQYLQRSNRTAQDTGFKTQVGGNSGRHGIEHGGGVKAG